MGNTTSSTNDLEVFNTNVANSLTESFTRIAQGGTQQASGSQVLNIEGINACPGGDIIISGITQQNISTFNFSQLASASTSQQMESAIKAAIVAACEQNQRVANELGAIANVSLTDQSQTVFSNNVNNIAVNVSTEQIQSIAQNQNNDQEINILNFNKTCSPVYGSGNIPVEGGDVIISDITQTIRMDLVASQVAQLVTEQVVSAIGEASVDASSTNTQDVQNTGFASLISAWFSGVTGIIVTVVIVLALLIAVIVIPVIVLRRRKRKQAEAQAQSAATATPSEAPTSSPTQAPVAPEANPSIQAQVKYTPPTQAPVAPEASPSIQAQAREFAKYQAQAPATPSKPNLSPSKLAGYAQQGISSAQKLLKSDTVKRGLSSLTKGLTKGL
jgi:hypothetical protein